MLSWLDFLSREERFIVERHLMRGLNWGMVSLAFEAKWGPEQLRHERTLKRYQAEALQKICGQINKKDIGEDIASLFADLLETEGFR